MAASTGNVVGVHYRVGIRIRGDSSGVIFEGSSLLSTQNVAIIFEPRKSDAPHLRDQYRTYRVLQECPGIPNVYYFGQEGLYNILVIDLLGPSLEDLFYQCNRRFSIKTVAMIAKQMISRVQAIHEKCLIYCDINPDNFLIGIPGTKTANIIHITDFRMAKQYRDPRTKQHIPFRERKTLSGAARYMSINTHLGRERSRRDDLVSLGYVFMYFLRGGLPWQGLKTLTKKQTYEKVGIVKQTTVIADLCKGFPEEFSKYFNYVYNLGFEDTPDYDYLRDLFTKALKTAGEIEDSEYDWVKINNGKGGEAVKQHPSQHKLDQIEDDSVAAPLLQSQSHLRHASPSPRFSYKPLNVDRSEIRVLTIHCAPQYQDQPDLSNVVCSIEHVPLTDPGVYIALSYCWGNSQDQQTIYIDDLPFLITTSLHSALRRVRDFIVASLPSLSPKSVRLWVDAVCINQADADEKSTQVRLMRQIYSRAREVVCYIRDETQDISSLLVSDAIKSNFIPHAGSDEADTERWTALEAFFLESYWTRVWVIQEIAVAVRAIVLYGDASIPWDSIAATLTSWKENSQIFPLQSRGFLNAIHLVEFRQRFMIARQPIRLLDAIYWSFKTQATDPRDKIFALLGLCSDSETYVPIPNYREPLEKILYDMGRRMMLLNRSLDLICLKGVNAVREPPITPTWLPDWPNIWSGSLSLLESRLLEKHNVYPPNPTFDISDPSKLKVRGVFEGHVTGSTSVMSPRSLKNATKPTRLPWILSTADLQSQNIRLQNGKPDEIFTRDAISRALTMDLLPGSISQNDARHCFSLLWMPEGRGSIHNLDFIDWIDTNAWFALGEWTLREWSQLGPPSYSSSNSSPKSPHTRACLELYLQTIERVLSSGLKLIVSNQDLVGSAHPDIEVGDSIYWIHGCDEMVALRKKELPDGSDAYRVVGAVRMQCRSDSLIPETNRDFTTRDPSKDHTHSIDKDIEELTLI